MVIDLAGARWRKIGIHHRHDPRNTWHNILYEVNSLGRRTLCQAFSPDLYASTILRS